jgi:hypothetical protein
LFADPANAVCIAPQLLLRIGLLEQLPENVTVSIKPVDAC